MGSPYGSTAEVARTRPPGTPADFAGRIEHNPEQKPL